MKDSDKSSGIITMLEAQKRNKERVNVYLDGEYAFSLTLLEAAKLRKGQALTAADVTLLRDADTVLKAVDRAAHFLSYRPRSIQEVRRNLEQKDTPPAVIDAAVARMSEQGYLDDAAFARYWVENRNTFKPLSPRALRHELRQKGIDNAVINEVLSDLDADEAAYTAARGQVSRLRVRDRRQFRTKLGGFLQRRGFSYATANDVIQRLLDEIDAEDPEFFADADADNSADYDIDTN